ncbi:GNAT family N-acetyltransferase [Flavihumibacter sp. UBA7668]|uniref:GNAT family N-acetyltransferase n=1 Tax=Flavihumibacter sp. UBA7668 TaxID=1946542 RepID=UPI0025BFCB94|nr:GNAT family N-acetyltransferase [Flavihumibacter sp. UBA7668]
MPLIRKNSYWTQLSTLAVEPLARGKGIGQSLTQECIRRAREKAKNQLILHTTRAMQVAWKIACIWISFEIDLTGLNKENET